MADDDEIDDGDESEEDDDEQEDKDGEGGGSRKKLFIIIGAVVVLLIGCGAGAYFAGLFDAEEQTKESAWETNAEPVEGAERIYKEFPEILTNLNEGRRKKVGVRIKVVLELSSEEESLRLDVIIPKVHDSIQVFIRGQKSKDLKGSTGMQRIREELLRQLNKALSPSKIRDLYFKEMLVR